MCAFVKVRFCNVRVSVFLGFLMCGFVFIVCFEMCSSICGFCIVCLCVDVGFVVCVFVYMWELKCVV